MLEESHKYDDIIDMPHHVSEKRERMTIRERAAQFSAFEALTGLDDQIDETARLTDTRLEPDEERAARIDANLQYLSDNDAYEHEVRVVHFVSDELKSGGAYIASTGIFKRIDETSSSVVLIDGTVIPISDIWDISVKGVVIE